MNILDRRANPHGQEPAQPPAVHRAGQGERQGGRRREHREEAGFRHRQGSGGLRRWTRHRRTAAHARLVRRQERGDARQQGLRRRRSDRQAAFRRRERFAGGQGRRRNRRLQVRPQPRGVPERVLRRSGASGHGEAVPQGPDPSQAAQGGPYHRRVADVPGDDADDAARRRQAGRARTPGSRRHARIRGGTRRGREVRRRRASAARAGRHGPCRGAQGGRAVARPRGHTLQPVRNEVRTQRQGGSCSASWTSRVR